MYTCIYLGRYSYNANISAIIDAFGTNKADAGLVTSCFFFAYGAGQVVNGILCRRYSKRYILSGALLVSSAINLSVFLGIPFPLIKYLWILNGFVQSVFWSSLVLLLSENTEGKMMERAILVMSTTTACGTLLSYGAASLFNATVGFKFSFLLAPAVMVTVALFWFFASERLTVGARVKKEEVPKEAPPVTKRQKDAAFFILLVSLSFFAVLDNLVKDGVTTWVPVVLKQEYGLPDYLSILMTLVLPMISIFGAMSSVWFNHFIKDLVTLAGVFFAVGLLGLLAIVLLLQTAVWFALLLACALVSMMMSAINNVIVTMAPMYLRAYVNSGALSGILNGFCYVGSTLSSYGIGLLADRYSWGRVFTVLLAVCVVPAVFTLLRASLLRFSKNKAF